MNLLISTKISYAQSNGNTLNPKSEFKITEFSNKISYTENISSIDIPLASASWNISNIEMNLTNIKLGKEIKSIEEEGDSIKEVSWKEKKGYGVEINVTESTIIFGAYLYSYYVPINPSIPVYVQIQGYDIINNAPDNNVLGSTMINISEIPHWYYQEFDEEVELSPGQYYLVINGSLLGPTTDKTTYNWFYNQSSFINPGLHTAVHDGVKWDEENVGKPFLHKLIQRVEKTFTPEEVNMTLDIDGSLYPVSGNGSISIQQIISPNNTVFHIPLYNNRSIQLLFDLSYNIKMRNFLISVGDVLIQDGLANIWTLEPDIQRCFYNYSIKFNYPVGWYNLKIFRDIGGGWVDISSQIINNTINHTIFILNNSFIEGADWRITANSPNLYPSLTVPKLEFRPGQEIQFSVNAPINPGNLTFRLFNSIGFLAQPDIIYVIDILATDDLILTYQLPDNPYAGIYKAYLFWHNRTAAGVITQEFEIIVPFTLDPIFIAVIVGAVAFIAIFSFTTIKVFKRIKRKHEEHRQKIFNQYMDVINLDYFIIIHKKSGLNVYEQILASKSIDASLITGFLEAIRTFGIELTGADEQSQTIKLEYQKSKILMSEFKAFRILLIMKENPSQDFLESIKTLSYDIDNKYGERIENFEGNVTPFQGIKDLLDQHLQTSLIYPLHIVKQDVKLNSDEKSMLNRANRVMQRKNKDYFIVTNLLSIRKGFYAKEAEIILNLIQKKVFQPKE
jgi:hypothetical protein